jgi:uncharacterized PurR-regulated membrane protein YhhQ (DUF165 family)
MGKRYVGMYLISIVLANLSVAYFGPTASIVNAFLFIGLDITARDTLHDMWHENLKRNMAILIISGSVLSLLLESKVLPIAIASCVAFFLANVVDTAVYSALHNRNRFQRVNGSNLAASLVDSTVFPILAFGGIFIPIMAGQFIAKVLGGYMWSLILKR